MQKKKKKKVFFKRFFLRIFSGLEPTTQEMKIFQFLTLIKGISIQNRMSSSPASSIDVLTEGLKRSIAPKMRKLDASMATAQWTQREVIDGIDRCSLAVEEVLRLNNDASSSSMDDDDEDTKRGEEEGEEKGKDR